MKIKNLKYTIQHKLAFLKVEKQLLGKNTIRGLLHDIDKLFLYLFFSKSFVSKLHRKNSRHHDKAFSRQDYIEMIIDWESARYTKPDKPLNARQTLELYYPHLTSVILPIIKELKI